MKFKEYSSFMNKAMVPSTMSDCIELGLILSRRKASRESLLHLGSMAKLYRLRSRFNYIFDRWKIKTDSVGMWYLEEVVA